MTLHEFIALEFGALVLVCAVGILIARIIERRRHRRNEIVRRRAEHNQRVCFETARRFSA